MKSTILDRFQKHALYQLTVGFRRSRFLNGFVNGIDMRSANVSPGDLLATLNRALEQYNVVMFDVHSDSLGVAAISMEDMSPGSASSDPRIPIFEEVMDLCRRKNAKAVVKVRHYNHQLFTDILDYVKRYNLFPHVVVTSHNPVVPYMIKKRDSQILTGLSYSRHGITSRFARTEGDSHFYKYLGQFLDDAVQFAVQHFILPKFVGSDLLFVDQDDISLNLVKAATARNITIVGTLVDGAGEESWMKDVAKVSLFDEKPHEVVLRYRISNERKANTNVDIFRKKEKVTFLRRKVT
ncbi:unnamed protein product [Haemonchus placei]|uniref:GP-PDE domain-containing protein n=1 Tax=Haemonchus placei TaxID=6290 RepID=A0A0N4WCV1_HAEPC|nr:unnamed protein product [Haemonchus placei]